MKEITRLLLPLQIGKKQVTINDKPETSSSNTQKHEVHQKVQQTNIPVIPSTRVNTSTKASGSKPRSNTKKNRILPAKSENKKKVEDHHRTNKSVWTKVNRVDSSISSKRVVINSNSESCAQRTKWVWKATGKLFTNVGYQWRPTGKKFTLGKLNCGYQWRPIGKKFALGELCPLTRLPVTCGTDHPLVFRLRLFKTYDGESFKAQELCGKVHRNLQQKNPSNNGNNSYSEPVPTATVVNAPIVSTNTSVSTTIAQDAPSSSHSLSSSQVHPPVFPQGVAAGPTIEDTSITQADLHPSVNLVAGEPSSAQSTSGDVSLAEPNQVTQPPDHLKRWTKDHPLDNIVGNPSRPVSTRKQLASDALWCWFVK
ncbi:hypothetical protein Tco_1100927 [Tanacetum coccineum]